MTNTTGDYGVDLIAAKANVRTAVQCKRQAACPAQQHGDHLIPTLRGVLVAHRRRRGGVTEAGHQLGDRGTRGGRQHGPGAAQVMQP